MEIVLFIIYLLLFSFGISNAIKEKNKWFSFMWCMYSSVWIACAIKSAIIIWGKK